MRKIYQLIICTSSFLFLFFAAQSQTYSTIADGPMEDPATWAGGVYPPTPCDNCLININNNVSLNSHFQLTNSSVNIATGLMVDIDGFLELSNTEVVVSGGAVVNVNDEVHLYGTSDVQIYTNASGGGQVNAANLGGATSTGTLGNGLPDAVGIYYINQAYGTPVTNATSFTMLLNGQYGHGGNFNRNPFPNPLPNAGLTDMYTFNCDGSFPVSCITGFVYGPASLQLGPNPSASGPPIMQFVLNAALPVSLSQFAASLNANQTVSISWSTSLEVNSDYYAVERSGDGVNWTALTKIKAKGQSSVNTDYNYLDASPLPGVDYYRLKMVDIDGKYKYSKTAQVSFDGKTVPLVIYNNPFQDQIRVKINLSEASKIELTLTDMLGKTYTHQSIAAHAGDNFVNITPSGISSGLYILNINGQSYHQTAKLVKQ